MNALLVVDMQEGLLHGDAKHELSAIIGRIDRLAGRVRRRGGCVFFVQHDGAPGDRFAPGTPGWSLLAGIRRDPRDRVVRKRLNDAFHATSLHADLRQLGVDRVLVAGWATDLCVDATVRSAVALGFEVVVAADCHTVSDRPHLPAPRVIEHHHWVWANLIAPRPVAFLREAELP
jgi:nicotinamidase-related amidase